MANQESRVKKSLLNARVNLIFYFLTLTLSFFSRKIFLDTLGADFVGLTSTLQNLLGFLNLAELGIGSAIGYVLYKPLFDHDEAKINEIISVFGYLYRWIGFIILGAGLVLGACLPLIFPSTEFEMGVIFFAYFAFLTSSLIGYFINYRQTLLGADQKNYVVTAYFQSATIVKTLIQMASAWYTGSYYLWVAIELTFGIVYSFILNWKINQTYPWLRSEVRLGRKLFKKYPEVMKYTRQLFVHQISGVVQFQTTPFLTYAFVSLRTVAYYGNYTIISDKLTTLLVNLWGSIGASIGNLIAEGNVRKIVSVFWELTAVRFLVGGVVTFSLYFLLPAFVTLWLGAQYLLPSVVMVLLSLNFFIGITHQALKQFLYGYGLFSDTWAPVAEACIYLGVALVGGHYWGLPGILLGGITSQLLILCLWKPIFLFRRGFKFPVWTYFVTWAKYLFLVVLSWVGAYFFTHLFFTESYPYESWSHWLIYGCACTLIVLVVLSFFMWSCTQGMRSFVQRMFHR